jgi:replicative DNA helicase
MSELPRAVSRPLSAVLAEADAKLRRGDSAAGRVWATGFRPLDAYLSGGLRSGELTLVGGPQGFGKTTFVLQVLRNVVERGGPGGHGLYLSYEHDQHTVLERLIALEAGLLLGAEAVSQRRIREALEALDGRAGTLAQRLADSPAGPEAVAKVSAYGDRLFLHRANSTQTDVAAIRAQMWQVAEITGEAPYVVVDYLQKVAVPGGSDREEERVTVVVEGLKDLSMEMKVPVVAIVAAERSGLVAGKRLRVHDLRGSTALAYEPDVILLLNDKYDVVARHHLVYDLSNADRFRGWAVLTIEKNRSGLDRIDLEFRKRFDQGRFDPDGQTVSEQLVDERVFQQ